jgi:demethylmenaquinone methyltransferase/2-methoxy-6-polyprenyl-1,4-benzoquinol methylase
MDNTTPPNKLTDFGFEKVTPIEKTERVADVFSSVANKYDIMNDFMSFGLHRLWKRAMINASDARPGQHILDIAGGTGDITRGLSEKVGDTGLVVLTDINGDMLNVGRTKLIDNGYVNNIAYAQVDGETLPFADGEFDCVTIAFGLRNITNKQNALDSMYRVLKPGGRLLILEFSSPKNTGLKSLYDGYSFNVIPKIGKLICNDEESYRYLVESIRMHPDQDRLKNMLEQSGYEDCSYRNFVSGVVALHKGYKY